MNLNQYLLDEIVNLQTQNEALNRRLEKLEQSPNWSEEHILETPCRVFRAFLVFLSAYDPSFPLKDLIKAIEESEINPLNEPFSKFRGDEIAREFLQRRITEVIREMIPEWDDAHNGN